jgi:hypothetical protein
MEEDSPGDQDGTDNLPPGDKVPEGPPKDPLALPDEEVKDEKEEVGSEESEESEESKDPQYEDDLPEDPEQEGPGRRRP